MTNRWSEYATELLLALRSTARAGGWMHKLRYLLYEDLIAEADVPRIADLEGVLLQSKPDADGRSQNPSMRQLQTS